MLKLMRLELRKNKTSWIKGILIVNLAILAFMTLVIFTEEGEFSTFTDVFEGLYVFVNGTFIIYASVLLAKLVIDEFKNNTITVLFMYPISRKKLISAKLMIVFLFTLISIFASDIILSVLLGGIDYYVKDVIQGQLTAQMLLTELPSIALDAVYAAGIGLIPLFFGMRKKSVPATIVTAILVVSMLSSGFGNFRLGNQAGVALSLSLIGIGIAYLSFRNIEHKDIA
ncbi:ABC transporter permease [Paenibacillus sp. PK3_47]|nr:ABC transporter permease [Paenibacillus sp. PK3_47]